MKMTKRLLALLLCLVLLASLFPAAAFAEGEGTIAPAEEPGEPAPAEDAGDADPASCLEGPAARTKQAEKTGWAVSQSEAPRGDEVNVTEHTIDVPDIDPSSLTETGVYNAMLAMKADFPEGMHWTNDDFYAWYGGIFYGGYGCAGFVFLLSDAAFGKLPARRALVDYEKLRVGDILRVNGDTHSVIVLEVHPDHVVIAEGNYNASIHWGRTMTRDEVEQADYMMTRWPSEEEGPDLESCSISLRMDPQVLEYDQPFTLCATVTDVNGAPVVDVKVEFAIMTTEGALVETRPLNGYDLIRTLTDLKGEAVLSYAFAKADGRIEPGKYLAFARLVGLEAGVVTDFELLDDGSGTDRIPGDVTGDGIVNGKDLIRLRKHLAGATVEIVEANADVTGDGVVNGKDLVRLRKYLAGENVVLQ
ncbi:MAG: dockerin type I repeat-containing protein [Oscillospiraceae bacterium]|nr:dockerin type I repeat-containing protein [Oscillospiraceae bacterium]